MRLNWLALGLSLFVAGCSHGPATSTLEGSVKLDGVPVPAGYVVLLSEDGLFSANSPLDEHGKFKIANAPLGKIKASVDVPVATAAGITKLRYSKASAKVSASTHHDVPEIAKKVPARYRDAAKSGLSFLVADSGANVWNIELTSKQ